MCVILPLLPVCCVEGLLCPARAICALVPARQASPSAHCCALRQHGHPPPTLMIMKGRPYSSNAKDILLGKLPLRADQRSRSQAVATRSAGCRGADLLVKCFMTSTALLRALLNSCARGATTAQHPAAKMQVSAMYDQQCPSTQRLSWCWQCCRPRLPLIGPPTAPCTASLSHESLCRAESHRHAGVAITVNAECGSVRQQVHPGSGSSSSTTCAPAVHHTTSSSSTMQQQASSTQQPSTAA